MFLCENSVFSVFDKIFNTEFSQRTHCIFFFFNFYAKPKAAVYDLKP